MSFFLWWYHSFHSLKEYRVRSCMLLSHTYYLLSFPQSPLLSLPTEVIKCWWWGGIHRGETVPLSFYHVHSKEIESSELTMYCRECSCRFVPLQGKYRIPKAWPLQRRSSASTSLMCYLRSPDPLTTRAKHSTGTLEV